MPYTPNKWGPASTSKDYEFFMQGARSTDAPISLLNHALTSPSQELSDPVTVAEEKKVNGRRVVVNKTVRAAQQTGLTYTLLFPSSLWTPGLDRARRLSGCETDFFALRTCLDAEYEHAYIYPDALLDPPSEVNDFITLEDDTQINEQTTLRVQERKILWGLKASRARDEAAGLYAVGFNNPDCPGCSDDLYTDAFAGGGDGTAAVLAVTTEDRFSTVANPTTGIPAGSVITSVYTAGDITLVGFADEATITGGAGAASGGTAMSSDGGSSFTLDTNLTEPVWAVGFAFGQYLAVGGTAAGAAKIWVSDNGIEWTAVSATSLAGTNGALGLSIDNETGNAYVVGEGGKLWKLTFSGGGIVVTDLSANLPGTPGQLNAVHVLAEDHIMVGGASAYCAESFDGGASFRSVAVPGVAAVRCITGTKYRVLIGIGTKIQERSIITKNVFREVTISDGVTIAGNYTAAAMPPTNAYLPDSYFIFVTDVGEIVFLKPRYPNA